MESLTIPCKSSPLDFSLKPIKAANFLSKTHQPVPSKNPNFAQLNNLIRIGSIGEVITALDSIAQNGSKIKAYTYTQLLDWCIDLNSAQFGRELHGRIELVDGVNQFVETRLVSMYAKCGCLDDARKVFDKMSERNLFTWSAIIGAYAREKHWSEVVSLFGLMMQEGVLPDWFLFPRILQACANCGDYGTGRLLHSLVVRSGMSSHRRVSNALLSVYAKCGKLSLARRLLEEMDERDMVSWNSVISGYCLRGENVEAHRLFDMMREDGIEPGLVTWNILIAGYNQAGDCDAAMELMKKLESSGVTPDVFTWTSVISGLTQNSRIFEALELFREMIVVGVQPNEVTIACAVSGCTSVKSLERGKEIHSFAVKFGLSDNVLVGNAVIDMYSKCGELDDAREVFDLISEKDVYSWNSMIGGYCQGGYCSKGHDLFMEMQRSNLQPNVVTWNLMISSHFQNGDEDEAMDLFQRMGRRGMVKPDTSTWNSLISGYLQIGQKNKALGVFRQMQTLSIRPNAVTILTVLPACANLIAANKVKEIHACALRGSLDSIAVLNALIDTYSKSGNIVYPRSIFDLMLSKDIITWNSLIAGYVLHGCSGDAIYAFDQMKREKYSPNRGTFVSLILAYSRAKMVEEGKLLFYSMTNDYHIVPSSEHYSAMVDLFGRSGRLKEAMEFIECMEVEPDSAIWEALLTASRCHGNVALMIHAGEKLLKLNPENNMMNYLVSQAYRFYRRSVDPFQKRSLPGYKYTKRNSGCSLLQCHNMVHLFVSGDRSMPGMDSLYTWLKGIAGNVKLPDSNNMPFIHEEDDENICGVHSEKLAIAFALVSSRCKVKCIRIVKNFRTCEDCHCTAKYISSSYDCEILLSDTKGLHHFKNGRCSCGDYW